MTQNETKRKKRNARNEANETQIEGKARKGESMRDDRYCTAKSKRSGKLCRNYRIPPTTKCRMHGGKNKRGIEHGGFKNGLRSKAFQLGPFSDYVKERAKKKVDHNLDEAIFTIEAMIQEALASLESTESVVHTIDEARKAFSDMLEGERQENIGKYTEAKERLSDALNGAGSFTAGRDRVLSLIERFRRTVDSERKAQYMRDNVMTFEQSAMLFILQAESLKALVLRICSPDQQQKLFPEMKKVQTNILENLDNPKALSVSLSEDFYNVR